MKEDKDKKERGEVSRRDFLVGAGAVVVGGAIGAGITYPLVSGDGDGEVTTVTNTKTVSVPTTVTTTVGDGATATVTDTVTTTVGDGATVTKTVTTTMPGDGVVEPAFEEEKTVLRGFGLSDIGHATLSGRVDIKNNKIIRIRSTQYDAEYPDLESWSLEAKGKVFTPPKSSMLNPLYLSYKKRAFSPNRVKYPLKRVDWEPGGVNVNSQNRGVSKFERITWDEAADMIASELTRIRDTYGPEAVALKRGAHGQTKTIHAAHGMCGTFMDLLSEKEGLGKGKFTDVMETPISWEGSYWGSKHVWGYEPFGYEPTGGHFVDICNNTEQVLLWGGDAECKSWLSGGQLASLELYWYTSLGIKQIYISPDLNSSAAVHADRWIPVLPNTDVALMLAIAYVWITEDSYDKDYVDTHTVGFDAFKSYVMGDEDGIPKTPEWASPLCGVSEWTIKALAREFASKTTSIMYGALGGGTTRGQYSHEMQRMHVVLLAMQGVGKPGVHQTRSSHTPSAVKGAERSVSTIAGYRSRLPTEVYALEPVLQWIPGTYLADAILNEAPFSWYGGQLISHRLEQFKKYSYPAEGMSPIHMVWTDGPCITVCGIYGHRAIRAFRSPNLEFHLAQHPWMEDDCMYADIVLPTTSVFEDDDMEYEDAGYSTLLYMEKCLPPVGESRSDYEALIPIAEKLGIKDEFTGGKTVQEWMQFIWENSGVQDEITWEDLKEKLYYVFGPDPAWVEVKPSMLDFYNDPDNNPLGTPSGKIEFESIGLTENFPDDKERPPVPHWVTGGPKEEGWLHDESREGERAEQYPLLMVCNTPKWRCHAQLDDNPWLREINKVKGPDGYMYEPLWVNPADAAARGLEDGDIIKIYNDRGATLAAVYVNERTIPGAVIFDHGSRTDPITTELDRGGSANLLCPGWGISNNCCGIAITGYLVEIEKADLQGLREQYPEAFARDYDPASGLRVDGWIEGGTN